MFQALTDGGHLWVPLYVLGESHKSVFSPALVAAWVVKVVNKNPTMVYGREVKPISLPVLVEAGLRDRRAADAADDAADPTSAKLALSYLRPDCENDQLNGCDLTRLACPKADYAESTVMPLGYRAASVNAFGETEKNNKPQMPKKAMHLLK